MKPSCDVILEPLFNRFVHEVENSISPEDKVQQSAKIIGGELRKLLKVVVNNEQRFRPLAGNVRFEQFR